MTNSHFPIPNQAPMSECLTPDNRATPEDGGQTTKDETTRDSLAPALTLTSTSTFPYTFRSGL
jgi:hypothetical protein